MKLQALAAVRSDAGGARIALHVRAPAAVLAELDIVDVRSDALLVEREQLVLRPVKAPHAAVRLGPDAQVEGDEAVAGGGGMDDRISP